jgi:hypothetical protein
MISRIWIVLTLITLLAGYGFNHKVVRSAQSVNLQEVFR